MTENCVFCTFMIYTSHQIFRQSNRGDGHDTQHMERREMYIGSWCGNLKERIVPNTYPRVTG